MTTAQETGLLMLTWVGHKQRPNYHGLNDFALNEQRELLGSQLDMLRQYLTECREALAECQREVEYTVDQLGFVEGILEVRDMSNDFSHHCHATACRRTTSV